MSTGEPKHRILVVEDEAMVSMLIEDMVLDCGCEVIVPVATFDRALEFAREGGVRCCRSRPQLGRDAQLSHRRSDPRAWHPADLRHWLRHGRAPGHLPGLSDTSETLQPERFCPSRDGGL
jgi:CheY-like chemotaxis protein